MLRKGYATDRRPNHRFGGLTMRERAQKVQDLKKARRRQIGK